MGTKHRFSSVYHSNTGYKTHTCLRKSQITPKSTSNPIKIDPNSIPNNLGYNVTTLTPHKDHTIMFFIQNSKSTKNTHL